MSAGLSYRNFFAKDVMKRTEFLHLLDELVDAQKKKVLACGRQFVPTLTAEDVLQPNDYPELENNPSFRYEEGVLEGILTVQAALRGMVDYNRIIYD